MKERKRRKSVLDPAQADWTIIGGGDGGLPDEVADLIGDLLLDVLEKEMAQ